MDLLLPSLDPEFVNKKANKSKKKEGEHCELDARYIMTEEISNLDKINDEKVSSNSLAENFPCYYSFYPSDHVMSKLIQRMTQIKSLA
jgi:hypothetical protein